MDHDTEMFQSAEHYRLRGLEWVDLKAAASLLEESKTAVLSQRKKSLGEMADSKAETIIKATPSWHEHLETMVEARRKADVAFVELTYAKMKFQAAQDGNATERLQAKLL